MAGCSQPRARCAPDRPGARRGAARRPRRGRLRRRRGRGGARRGRGRGAAPRGAGAGAARDAGGRRRRRRRADPHLPAGATTARRRSTGRCRAHGAVRSGSASSRRTATTSAHAWTCARTPPRRGRRGRLVDRVRPRRAGHRAGAADRPRARRRRRVDHARAGHGARRASRCSTSARGAGSRRCTRRGTRGGSSAPISRGARSRSRGSTRRCWTCRADLREGSLLEPVAASGSTSRGQPAVRHHAARAGMPRYDYRDGGRAGDAIVRELVEGVGAVLAPGGIAQLPATGRCGAARSGASASAPGWSRASSTGGRSMGAARPRAVRRDVDPGRRHDPRPGPRRMGGPVRRGWTTSRRGRRRHRLRLRDPAQAARGTPTLRRLEHLTARSAAPRPGRSRRRSPRTTGSRRSTTTSPTSASSLPPTRPR